MDFFDKQRRAFKKSSPKLYGLVDKPANVAAVVITGAGVVVTGGMTEGLFVKALENATGNRPMRSKSGQPREYMHDRSYAGSRASLLLENLATVAEYYNGHAPEGQAPALTALSDDIRNILQISADQQNKKWCELVMKHKDNPIMMPVFDGKQMTTSPFPSQEDIDSCSGPVMRSGPNF